MKDINKKIVLIGMPGAGKTTIGKILAEKLSLKFIDLDEYIEEKYEETIENMFKKSETYFRTKETCAISEFENRRDLVLATGGGIVKKPENMEILKRNSIIIFINRDIKNIAADIKISTRPLLKDNIENLFRIYEERYILYKKYADYMIFNDEGLDKAIDDIIAVVYNE